MTDSAYCCCELTGVSSGIFHWPLVTSGFGRYKRKIAVERTVRCWQPVVLQLFGRGLVLHVQGQAAVGVELEVGQHARVDQVAIQRVGHQQFVLAVVHRQRPERVGRGQGALVEMQGVIVFRGVDRLAVLVDEIADVVRFFGGVAEDPHVGAGVAVQVIAFQVIAGTEEVAAGDLMGVNLVFLELRRIQPWRR